MKIKYQGKEVEATEVSFISMKEDFNEYRLADGTKLRIKLVLTDVRKVLGEVAPDGQTAYQVRTTNVVRFTK